MYSECIQFMYTNIFLILHKVPSIPPPTFKKTYISLADKAPPSLADMSKIREHIKKNCIYSGRIYEFLMYIGIDSFNFKENLMKGTQSQDLSKLCHSTLCASQGK